MKPIGIDLGTTNSAISVYENGDAITLAIEGQQTTPSVVYINNNEVKVGRSARQHILMSPKNILSSTKRNIGTSWQKDVEGKKYSAVFAASEILKYLVTEAGKIVKDKIKEVVITVPAYFNTDQKADTKKAAEDAGLIVKLLLAEPTAAAVAYGIDRENIDQTIAVIDLGGGTFDVSLLEVKNKEYIVKAVDGNSKLGGDDFDKAIVNYLLDYIKDTFGIDLQNDEIVNLKLKEEAEEIKKDLSSSLSVAIRIAGLHPEVNIDIDSFTREQYKGLIQTYLDEILATTKSVIEQAKMDSDDINRFVLVGGSCKSPLVRELIKNNFKEPFVADDMDTAVSRGAAIICNSVLAPVTFIADNEEAPPPIIIKDVLPQSLGIDVLLEKSGLFKKNKSSFVPILKRNTHYPQQGAYLAQTQNEWQNTVIINVFRGEDVDPDKNRKLGTLDMKISEDLLGKAITPLGCIFNLDNNGILSFSVIEMPINNNNQQEFNTIIDEAINNDGYISFEILEKYAKKNSFKAEEVIINTVNK